MKGGLMLVEFFIGTLLSAILMEYLLCLWLKWEMRIY